MIPSTDSLDQMSSWLHRHLLKLILLSYTLAAVLPAPGLWIKDAEIVDWVSPLGHVTISPPKLLLALLLFNAGMRVQLARVGQLVRRPLVLLAGLATNLLVPLLVLVVMAAGLRFWHNPAEATVVLLGLALVTSMPIAGSSTGWAQAIDGDMALSLGLVLGSTLLSPLTTPATLRLLSWSVPGPGGERLSHLAGQQTGTFLACWVLLPSLLGVLTRLASGERRSQAINRRGKIIAPLALLILCYANAATCLPQTLDRPDWDFLGIICGFVGCLCGLTFAAGFLLSYLLKVEPAERTALVFGLGMNNNGTGLVLAALVLGSEPRLLLPIIIYNLTQHLVAGSVAVLLQSHNEANPATQAAVEQKSPDNLLVANGDV